METRCWNCKSVNLDIDYNCLTCGGRHSDSLLAEVVEVLRDVLPYTEAERLHEAAKVRLGQHRNPIEKAVRKACDFLTKYDARAGGVDSDL